MKISNFWLLIILSLTTTSCAILGGQSPEKIKKNNTFYIYTNVEGAKIEVLNKPEKENFEPTNAKSGSGFYSVNTYSKLRLGRTKLLISKEGYEPDTIKIRRAPRPGVLTADICFFGPLVFLDILSPNFYKISKKTGHQNVYLSPTQEFMRLKYNEISKKYNVADYDDFIKKYPSSDCVVLAKSRRDSIINLNNEMKGRYATISSKNPALIKEFFFKYQLEYLNKSELFTSESFSILNRVKGQFFYNTLNEFSQFRTESEQSKFIEETKTELKISGLDFTNSSEFLSTLIKSAVAIDELGNNLKYSGKIQLYGQQFTKEYFIERIASYNKKMASYVKDGYKEFEEVKEMENTISLISSSNMETIIIERGKISRIDGFKNGALLYKIWFSRDVNQKRINDYKTVIKNVHGQARIDELSQDSEDSDYGFRFDNIVVQFFVGQNSILDEKEEFRYRLKSVHYYHPKYFEGGKISECINMTYLNGINEKFVSWEHDAFEKRQKGLSSNDWKEIDYLSGDLLGIVLEIKALELSTFAYDDIIPGVYGSNSIRSICERVEFWMSELENRENQLARGGESLSNQEITTNFCFDDNFGNKYEFKLFDKESGEGRVIYNQYKQNVLVKTVVGKWEERFISLGDATKIVINLDDEVSVLGSLEFYLRKYSNGSWQDIQEMGGRQRTWSYCLPK